MIKNRQCALILCLKDRNFWDYTADDVMVAQLLVLCLISGHFPIKRDQI